MSRLQPKHRSRADSSGDNELSSTVRKVMRQYFKDLDGEKCTGIYEMVVAAVEKPMLEVVMFQAQGNQTRAAELLGLSRFGLQKMIRRLDISMPGAEAGREEPRAVTGRQ